MDWLHITLIILLIIAIWMIWGMNKSDMEDRERNLAEKERKETEYKRLENRYQTEYIKTNAQEKLKNETYLNYITEVLKNQDEFALDIRYESAFPELKFYDLDKVYISPILNKRKQVIAYHEFHKESKKTQRITIEELSKVLNFYSHE